MKTNMFLVGLLGIFLFQGSSTGQESGDSLECVDILEVGDLKHATVNTTRCSRREGETCLRVIGQAYDKGQDVNFLVAGCFSNAVCLSSCEDFIAIGFDESETINVTNCDLACCNTDYCNNKTTDEIKKTQSRSFRSKTIEINNEEKRCSEFLSLEGENSLSYSTCSQAADTLCYRVEAQVTIQQLSDSEVSLVHADCFPRSYCNISCKEALKSFYGEFLVNISSCEQICCSGNNCNNRSLIEIKKQNNVLNNIAASTSKYTSATPLRSRSTSLATASTITKATTTTSSTTSITMPLDQPRCKDFAFTLEDEMTQSVTCFRNPDQLCYRLEADVTFPNYPDSVETLIFGDCIDRSLCNVSCQLVLNSLLNDTELHVLSCHHFCCGENNCNNQSLEEMENLTTSPTTEKSQTNHTTIISRLLTPRIPLPQPPARSLNTIIIAVVLVSVLLACLAAIFIAVVTKKQKRNQTQTGTRIDGHSSTKHSALYASVGPPLPLRKQEPEYLPLDDQKASNSKESDCIKPISTDSNETIRSQEKAYTEPNSRSYDMDANEIEETDNL